MRFAAPGVMLVVLNNNEESRCRSEAIALLMTTSPVQQLGEGEVIVTDLTPMVLHSGADQSIR